ncbi:MAG: carboxypeptidase-like regulatory domain-containing protein, partial [Blastocatellia bacterium]
MKKFFLTLLIIFCILSISEIAYGQFISPEIEGTVKDSKDQAIAGIELKLIFINDETKDGLINKSKVFNLLTSEEGSYNFRQLPIGNFEVFLLEKDKFLPKHIKVNMPIYSKTFCNFVLENDYNIVELIQRNELENQDLTPSLIITVVKDLEHSPINGAVVELTNEQTKQKQTVLTNKDGMYHF